MALRQTDSEKVSQEFVAVFQAMNDGNSLQRERWSGLNYSMSSVMGSIP